MTTTPNMGLVLPDNQGSANIWDVILQSVFGLLDAHNHTPGQGVKIPTGALSIDADVSWSLAGTSRAITDLRALDFSPQPTSGMVALAGALFLNSSDSELYWRTTAGTNVKFTNGAALNVAAFTGGFGGDYAAAGALALFDDATDSYWFQQQVGASVRQYARMRSADVDLYEFKANPTAGVPTNRVRLASPAALAASYALTFPAALPAATSFLMASSAGVLTTLSTGGTVQYPAAIVNPATGATITGAIAGAGPSVLSFLTATGTNQGPVSLPIGSVITSWTVYLRKTSASGTISAQLESTTMTSGATTSYGASQSNSANNPGFIQLTNGGLSVTVTTGLSYSIDVGGGGVTGDNWYGYSVTYT